MSEGRCFEARVAASQPSSGDLKVSSHRLSHFGRIRFFPERHGATQGNGKTTSIAALNRIVALAAVNVNPKVNLCALDDCW
jgi:hypothetical protein